MEEKISVLFITQNYSVFIWAAGCFGSHNLKNTS